MRTMRQMWITAAGLAILGLSATAQQTIPANIQKKLDQPVSLELKSKPIEEVFARLAEASGVDFRVTDDTLAFLPYGEETHMSVRLADAPLRKALPAILAPQALDWRIREGVIEIIPSEPLYRLARRSTFDELLALGKILSVRIDSEEYASQTGFESLLRAITGNENMQAVRLGPDGAAEPDAERFADLRRQHSPRTMAEWLDLYCRGRDDLTWYVADGKLIILPETEQIQRQLDQRVSVKYDAQPLSGILLDMARKGHFTMDFEPGSLAKLPARTRESFSLTMEEATIAQALKVIAGNTGLSFTPTPSGLHVTLTRGMAREEAAASPPEPAEFFLQTTVITSEGREVKVFILPGQLPPDLREAIRRERSRIIEDLEAHYLPGESADGETDEAASTGEMDATGAADADASPAAAPEPPTP